jgi:hypothetical protein
LGTVVRYRTCGRNDFFLTRFEGLVRRACEKTGERVVILVDEYDKPLLQTIGNETLQEEYRSTLKAFYSVLKTQDEYIKFAFLTGVTKFGKVSVFSDLNNLEDLSMNERLCEHLWHHGRRTAQTSMKMWQNSVRNAE